LTAKTDGIAGGRTLIFTLLTSAPL